MQQIQGVMAAEAGAGAVRLAPTSPAIGRQANPTAPTPARATAVSAEYGDVTISEIFVTAQECPQRLGQVPVGLTSVVFKAPLTVVGGELVRSAASPRPGRR